MKKFMILAVVTLMSLPLLSFSNMGERNSEIINSIGPCEDYCTGYADGVESATPGGMTLEEWNEVYNTCLNTASQCED